MAEELIPISALAERLGVTKRCVQYWIEKGGLKAVRVSVDGKKPQYQCRESDVKAMLDLREAKERIRKRAEEFGKDLL